MFLVGSIVSDHFARPLRSSNPRQEIDSTEKVRINLRTQTYTIYRSEACIRQPGFITNKREIAFSTGETLTHFLQQGAGNNEISARW